MRSDAPRESASLTPIRGAGRHPVTPARQPPGAVDTGGDATTTASTPTTTTTTTTSTDSARIGTTTTTTAPTRTTTTTTGDTPPPPQTTLSPQARSVLQANREGELQLIEAVRAGDLVDIKKILANAPLLHRPLEKGATALHLAARAGHTEIVDHLVSLGAPADAPGAAGMTPLHEAAKAGHANTVAYLLGLKVDPDATEYTEDATPLHLALKSNQEKVVEVLLAWGANVNAQTRGGATAFYVATTANRLKMASWLLARGADINLPNHHGFTPLHSACANTSPEFVEWLLAQPQILKYQGFTRTRADALNARGHAGLTAVHIAAGHGQKEILEFLIRQPGVRLKTRDDRGLSVLSYAAQGQAPEALIKSLCAALGKETTEKLLGKPDQWGDTPLSKAVDGDLPASTRQLLQTRAKAAPVTLRPTHYKRGWCIVGDDIKTWSKDAIDSIGAQAHIEIRHHGDGRTALHWQTVQALDIRSGDFVIFKCHCGWDELLKTVTASLSKGEKVPVTTIARWLFGKGVQKVLFLGCKIAKAAAPLQSRFAFDPGFPQPVAGGTGLQGLEYTFAGREDRTLQLVNTHTAIHWLHALVATRDGTPLSATTRHNLALQPLHTLCWKQTGPEPTNGQLLVQTSPMVDADGLDGLTPEAAHQMRSKLLLIHAYEGHLDDVKALIEQHGVDPNGDAGIGELALHLACAAGHTSVATYLLDHGANVGQRDSSGNCALHGACHKGHVDSIRLLLGRGADVDQATTAGKTSLHIAAQDNQMETVRLLLNAGADVHARSLDRRTPLHAAAETGRATLVNMLLRHHAPIDAADQTGCTPLHLAIAFKKVAVVRALVNAGANVNAKLLNQQKPLDMAKQMEHTEMIGLLKAKGAQETGFFEALRNQ